MCMIALIPNKYRIWYGQTENASMDRREIARVKAFCVSDVVDYAQRNMINAESKSYPEYKFNSAYIVISPCYNCGLKETDPELCDDCELTEYVEIQKDNNIAEKFMLPSGEELFHDLTVERNKIYAKNLLEKHVGSISGEIPKISKDEIFDSIKDGFIEDEKT